MEATPSRHIFRRDMADPPPELPFELGDLSSTKVNTETSPASSREDVPVPTTPPQNSAVRNERQRVRFNSSDVEGSSPPPPRRSTSRDPNERFSPPGLRMPRPALSRNPSSYNSVTDNVHNIPLSPVKAKSAADAARRAQALAADAQRHSNIVHDVVHEHGYYDPSGRWSPESEPVTEVSYANEPLEHYHHHHQNTSATQGESENTSEARELLRAHWQFLNQVNTQNSGMFSVFNLFDQIFRLLYIGFSLRANCSLRSNIFRLIPLSIG